MTEDPSPTDLPVITRFDGYEVLPAVVALLARGHPVGVEEVAEAAGRPRAEVDDLLRAQPGTDWDDAGRLVGFGLSLRPTEHRFVVGGRTLYTWCATDTLFFTVMLGQPAVVDASCPATSQAIHLELDPGAVTSVAPAAAVVTERPRGGPVADLRAEVCDHGRFYASPDAAGPWAAEHPDGRVLAVADAFRRSKASCAALGWVAPAHRR